MYQEIPVDISTIDQCVYAAAKEYELDPLILKSVISVEGGQIGTHKRNKDGSYDLGIMQINTINVPDVQKSLGISKKELILDPCKNILAGAWLLMKRIKEYPGKKWFAVGAYHSKTKPLRESYQSKVQKAYLKIGPLVGTIKEAEAIGRTTDWGKAKPLNLLVTTSQTPILNRDNSPRVITISSKRTILRFID